MDFLTHGLLLLLGHVDGNVRRTLDDLVGPAHGGRPDPLLGGSVARVAGPDHEVVLVQAPLVVLVRHVPRVGDGRAQGLLYLPRPRFLGEAEYGEGLARLLAPDEVQDQLGLLGRCPDVFGCGAYLEHGSLPRSWRGRRGARPPPGGRGPPGGPPPWRAPPPWWGGRCTPRRGGDPPP